MAVGPLSRYRGMEALEVRHATRGTTRSLPVRRALPAPADPATARRHRWTGYDTVDLLALRTLGREDLYWALLDANSGRLPDSYRPGDLLLVPSADDATRIERA
ncbi:hypothetical protein [Streptomyces fulvoviolaceus]|uniref:hypothetical protein n=1 Tax=Streptomyces fulvoviolaceus TaxID=285535 RepID=UPI0004C71738|nr:hypothetical protein [Streptomyces fulvoviolaceus]MCT9078069.1 hypothetical protein [Streptomyces fulvoviolaceus]